MKILSDGLHIIAVNDMTFCHKKYLGFIETEQNLFSTTMNCLHLVIVIVSCLCLVDRILVPPLLIPTSVSVTLAVKSSCGTY